MNDPADVNSRVEPAVRVMVIDDHPIWRDAVASDLSGAGFDVVATAGDGEQAVRRLAAARPDVILLDLQLPGMSGVETAERMRQLAPQVRVLVLSASGEQADVLSAVKGGASGYLVKSASREELVAAVRRTAAGHPVFTPGLAGLVLGEFRRMAGGPPTPGGPATPGGPSTSGGPATSGGPPAGLTERETEVLRLVAQGLGSRQIAERLGISHRTVQNHTQNVLTKLHLHNRVELARYALTRGLDDPANPGRPEPPAGGR